MAKDKYMVIVGFKSTEFNPLSFYSTGKPVRSTEGMVTFNDPMQSSVVSIEPGTFSFFSTKEITDEEFDKHKEKLAEQEKMEAMFSEGMSPQPAE